MSTALQPDLARRMREYAKREGIAIGRLIEQALAEYLSIREQDASIGPLARTIRRPGRPSKADAARRTLELAQLRKGTGRPIKVDR